LDGDELERARELRRRTCGAARIGHAAERRGRAVRPAEALQARRRAQQGRRARNAPPAPPALLRSCACRSTPHGWGDL
jgi:hypothetical protein